MMLDELKLLFSFVDQMAAENDLFVLEDAAQSFGGRYKGRAAGSLGHAGAASFFPAMTRAPTFASGMPVALET